MSGLADGFAEGHDLIKGQIEFLEEIDVCPVLMDVVAR
jgi:hypothetical protein